MISSEQQIVVKRSELLNALRFNFRYTHRVAILSLAIWIQGAPACLSDDLVAALTGYGKACEKMGCDSQLTLQRSKAGWRPANLRCMFDREANITDASLEPLKRLSALGSLDLYATWRKPDGYPSATAAALRDLAALHLRRFGFHQNLSVEEIKAVCSLKDLEGLELGDFNLRALGETDLVYICNLSKLRYLKLLSFDATQPAWRCITQLTGLTQLDVHYAEVNDKRVPRFSDLQGLQSLRIGVIGPDALSVLAKLPKFEHLDVLRFDSGDKQADFSVVRHLTWLGIGAVNGDRAHDIPLPKGLRRLDVDYDTIPQLDLRSAREIRHIQIDLFREYQYRNVNSNLDRLAACLKLRELELQDPTASDVKVVAAFTSLSELALIHQDECSTTGDDGVRQVAALKNLKSLIIQDFQSGEGAIDAGMDILRDFPNLQRLELTGLPGMAHKRLDAILGMKELRSLKLNLTSLPKMDSLLARMRVLTKLEELSLCGTVTDRGLASLMSLRSLRILDFTRADGYSTAALASLMSSLPDLHKVRFTISQQRMTQPSKARGQPSPTTGERGQTYALYFVLFLLSCLVSDW